MVRVSIVRRAKIWTAALLLLLFGTASAQDEICGVKISLGDWRVMTALALSVSATLIAAYLAFGYATADTARIARARHEAAQLLATAVIAGAFVAIAQLICTPAIPSFLGLPGADALETARAYAQSLVKSAMRGYAMVAWGTALISLAGSFEIELLGYWGRGLTRIFLDALGNAIGLLHSLMLTATVIIGAHPLLLDYFKIVSLTFLLPVGVAARAIWPARKWGGALIGIAFALAIVFPLLLNLNALLARELLGAIALPTADCARALGGADCWSKVCRETKVFEDGYATRWRCAGPLEVGKSCTMWWQCASGCCINTKCAECVGLHQWGCDASEHCGIGYACLWGQCVAAGELGEPCDEDRDCKTLFCDASGKCAVPLRVGAPCTRDGECASRWCRLGACSATIMTEGDLKLAKFISTASGLETIESGLYGWPLSAIEQLIIVPAVVTFIVGLFLPAINFYLVTRAAAELSAFFGAEVGIGDVLRLL